MKHVGTSSCFLVAVWSDFYSTEYVDITNIRSFGDVRQPTGCYFVKGLGCAEAGVVFPYSVCKQCPFDVSRGKKWSVRI
jgi:hypothetical protein